MMHTISLLNCQLESGVLIARLDHPPVNAVCEAICHALFSVIAQAQSDDRVKAVVITGASGFFASDVDVGELGLEQTHPLLPDVCDAIEASRKPVVAAIEGIAMGGGLQIALAAHLRVASRCSQLGFPEVRLGLLPGAGGTQRAPRLIGAAPALDLMLSGRSLTGSQAFEMGLVDEVVAKGLVLQASIERASRMCQEGAPPRRTSAMTRTAGLADRQAISAARAEADRKPAHPMASGWIIAAVEASLELPYEAGAKFERSVYGRCLESPQHAGLRHAALSERAAATPSGPESLSAPRRVAKVGVVGGGTMGAGIAVSMLESGLEVVMIERDLEALELGRGRIEALLAGMIAKRKLAVQDRDEAMAKFSGGSHYDLLVDCDLVVEAVFEDLAAKQSVFAQLDRACKPGAVLATNTSYLDIGLLARSTQRAADVIGLHFFSPAHVMRLLEIVVPATTANDVVATAFALARRLGKVPVRAGVCDGFIGNRILARYREAADHMLEDGASPYQIDRALRDFGFAMGPFEVSDLAGGDIGWAARKRRAPMREPMARYVRIADELCERGWYGRKTGRGWYRYAPGSRAGAEDPDVLQIVDEARRAAGIAPRALSDDEIVARYLAAMINEGANVLADGIAQKPSDVDVVLVNGFGFPRVHGGPMHHADSLGLKAVLRDIQTFAQADPLFWKPSPLLQTLSDGNRRFADLNR
jgi:3-hydroxyacyl-CoA dehydrogenase